MIRTRRILTFSLATINLLVNSCFSPSAARYPAQECIKPFQEFAYSAPDLVQSSETKMILPSHPWQIEATIPTLGVEDYVVSTVNVEKARFIDGHHEIWIAEDLLPTGSNQGNESVFLIYSTDEQDWKTISPYIEDTSLFVRNLFVTKDGSIWGTTQWDAIHGQPSLVNVPVLSKFNEVKQRFEFPEGVLRIPWSQKYFPYSPWSEIVLDNQDIFWIFAKNDGIYSYDPIEQKTEKQADLLGLTTIQTALSHDGSIYFETYNEKIYAEDSFFQLTDGVLFEFHPKTKEIVSLEIPNEPWPIFSGMVVDKDNRLWLGAIGYRKPNGDWQLIHPSPKQYFASAGDAYSASPTLILESSDGVLWYKKFLDDIRADGTGWYDPQTDQGCMFTNIATDIIEDSGQTLWLVAGGKLLKYELRP